MHGVVPTCRLPARTARAAASLFREARNSSVPFADFLVRYAQQVGPDSATCWRALPAAVSGESFPEASARRLRRAEVFPRQAPAVIRLGRSGGSGSSRKANATPALRIPPQKMTCRIPSQCSSSPSSAMLVDT